MDTTYTYDELKSALREMRKNSPDVVNTCYYFPGELKEKINSGIITYEIQNDAIVIYEHLGDFDSVMFCINSDSKKLSTDDEKSKLADVIYSETNPVKEYAGRVLEESGFTFLCKAFHMTASDFETADSFVLKNHITFATEDMAENIVDMWRKIFDPAEVYIHTVEEVREKISNNQVVVSVDACGELMGAVTSDMDNTGNAMIRHVAVSEKARGRGLGRDLCSFYIQQREKIGFDRATLWVEDYREAALNLYKKLGFKHTGKEMLRYVKKIKGGNNYGKNS